MAGPARLTQFTTTTAGTMASVARLTQFTVTILGKLNPCTPEKCPEWLVEGLDVHSHMFARLIEIERTDAVIFRRTDHIGALVYSDGETFTPVGGPSLSALEHESGEREHTAEMEGALAVGGIEMDEFEAGLFDDAKVTIRVVNWRCPWMGCYWHWRGYLRNVAFDGNRWLATLGGISSRMMRARGKVYARDCTNELGDAEGEPAVVGCHYAVSTTAESGTVATVISNKRTFTASGLTAAHIDEYFVNGPITWTGGANAPIVSVVRAATEVSAGVYQIEVEMSLPNAIGVGDTFSIRQGCQKRFSEDCTPKAQTADYSGFRFMPGEDGLHVNPNEPGI